MLILHFSEQPQNLQSFMQNFMQHFFRDCTNQLLWKNLILEPFDSLRLPGVLKCTRAHMLESTYVYFVFVDIYLWVNNRVPIFCQVKYRLFILMEFSQLNLMSSTYSTWRVGQCIHRLVPVNHSGCEQHKDLLFFFF